ncbi:hypothetical protein AVEN_15428-1 [Araneus ventricosus]|uniref:Uncharacterized protein n=1 Tax=Araneus ventricosus TaxID=182803 RepID=A0A4Y2CS33_ARAVE|nr:hypothetical protein AVEN_15428-1 [Araneus ventricosus]
MSSRCCGAKAWRGCTISGVVLVICRDSKFQCPSQNSPRDVSKRDANITINQTASTTNHSDSRLLRFLGESSIPSPTTTTTYCDHMYGPIIPMK